MIRSILRGVAAVFQSPAARHADAVSMFRDRGFDAADADRAAHELWRSCRAGQPTPQWILDRLRDA
jgi:hypothetical protein